MGELEINDALNKAELCLASAREGLCKPEEDVVPYSICENAYKSVSAYLQAFLLKHGKKVKGRKELAEMLAYCREVDPRFQELHLHPLFHPTETEDIWMNLDTANDFVSIAEKTRNLVTQN